MFDSGSKLRSVPGSHQRVRVTVSVRSTTFNRWFDWFGSTEVNGSARVKVQSVGQTLASVNGSQHSGHTRSTQDPECLSCTLASSHSWNDITESR
ncbi:hypothetical protein HanRHA438_Chr12g0576431 [Helianthus annuus]|uniref:Uncharacterized protein n=1 Tax=Helianthus annuus TaxID=4232 RepID=A0A251T6W3_HELAN|nr:hypothetical protein HanXRQr2_Chr12g0565061 [Helianthus annuus]KAJ0491155.1 hypothetical protein HanHA300_Chr12g0463681 [Helianthus annuus]KAJ0495575.1 hypothetical protein HanIR_Chr12g0610321 [Helianthus annuus]KAJ0507077.1 hypothetical protein HanHA89_Chr12g0489181 [Helianthus annuus]KAJ0676706.1 hypothetical protein HanLR1_Chr12g0465751 [Helianthus annuus]